MRERIERRCNVAQEKLAWRAHGLQNSWRPEQSAIKGAIPRGERGRGAPRGGGGAGPPPARAVDSSRLGVPVPPSSAPGTHRSATGGARASFSCPRAGRPCPGASPGSAWTRQAAPVPPPRSEWQETRTLPPAGGPLPHQTSASGTPPGPARATEASLLLGSDPAPPSPPCLGLPFSGASRGGAGPAAGSRDGSTGCGLSGPAGTRIATPDCPRWAPSRLQHQASGRPFRDRAPAPRRPPRENVCLPGHNRCRVGREFGHGWAARLRVRREGHWEKEQAWTKRSDEGKDR